MIYTDTSAFGETSGPIIYSKVNCQGWENSFTECPKNSYFDVNCPRSHMAGIVCRDGKSRYYLYMNAKYVLRFFSLMDSV